MKSFKRSIRDAGVRFARWIGGEICDVKTGELLGRGLAFSWRNKTHLIGYEGKPLIAAFEVQQRITYWRQTLGFTTHALPDFSNECVGKNERAVSGTLIVILTHQPPESVARMLEWWKDYAVLDTILIAYGGTEADFAQIAHAQKFFVHDPSLRTQDQQREPQSYTEIYQKAGSWLAGRAEFSHVYFAEFDHLPLVPDFAERMRSRLAAENADVLAFKLWRIDGTNYPHYLHAVRDPRFHEFWKTMSCRAEKEVVLSMLGTGSFWTREAFLAVSECAEPFPMYHEIYIPTLAHHLGFRLRDFGEQNQFVRNLGDFKSEMDKARAKGAWTLHPVKNLWE